MSKKLDAREMDIEELIPNLRRPGGFLSKKIRDIARDIVEDVRERGDAALLEYTERFDGMRPDPIRATKGELDQSRAHLTPDVEESFG
ncbi:MAG: histidinol dehydrogenase, partial [Rubrobacteraceae bacterium]